MTDKYSALADEIMAFTGTRPNSARAAAIIDALVWLDLNPDQVPGRTITRSVYRDTLNGAVLMSGYGDDWERGFRTGIFVAGAKVVPDPEPTNAEKLEAALLEAWDGHRSMSDVADLLDLKGVTAPEGSQ